MLTLKKNRRRAEGAGGTVFSIYETDVLLIYVQGPENLQECEAKKGGGGRDDGFNQTETLNGTTQVPRGFLEIFLDR